MSAPGARNRPLGVRQGPELDLLSKPKRDTCLPERQVY